jgi:hypothetical protein
MMMTWNYRIVKTKDEFGISYGVYEIFYSDDGTPWGMTEEAMFEMDTPDDVSEIIRIIEAFQKPVLNEEDFHGEEE